MTASRESLKALLEDLRRAIEAGDDEGVARLARGLAALVGGLSGTARSSTVNSSMAQTAEHRVALSQAVAPGGKWLRAIRKAGYSQNRLAAAVGMSVSALSAARRPKSDDSHRPIARSKALLIETLTGWPADAAHWPAGIRED